MNHSSHMFSAKSAVKRIFDFSFSLFAMIVIVPVLLLISIAIFLYDGHTPIVLLSVVGQGGKVFSYPVFRTSFSYDAERICSETEISDDNLTPVGNFILSLSLESLPALLCILLGKMSFVGPCPILCSEHEMINSRFACGAYSVKPGLTGLSQIYLKKGTEKRCLTSLDGLYAAGWSLSLDAHILRVALSKLWNR